jgi:hypothetical protein
MSHRQLLVSIGLLATLAPGCGFIDSINESLDADRQAMVQVHVTHHGTPVDGVFPDHGEAGEARVFETDEGWTVTLQEAFVVTRAASLIACDGTVIDLDLYWGALPESFNAGDLDLSTFGGMEVDAGTYCAVEVDYGPFEGAESAAPNAENLDDLTGATAYVEGFAQRGDELVVFSLRADDLLSVRVELDEPLEVHGDEAFPVELTLSKTYDRLFDAIDFSALSEDDLSRNAMAVLGIETRVSVGTRVTPN